MQSFWKVSTRKGGRWSFGHQFYNLLTPQPQHHLKTSAKWLPHFSPPSSPSYPYMYSWLQLLWQLPPSHSYFRMSISNKVFHTWQQMRCTNPSHRNKNCCCITTMILSIDSWFLKNHPWQAKISRGHQFCHQVGLSNSVQGGVAKPHAPSFLLCALIQMILLRRVRGAFSLSHTVISPYTPKQTIHLLTCRWLNLMQKKSMHWNLTTKINLLQPIIKIIIKFVFLVSMRWIAI